MDLSHLTPSQNMTQLILSPATRGGLITFTLFIVLMGVLGNSFVLVASLKYRAINIDRISIFLVENLAAADLLIAVVEYIPVLVTLLADGKWVLGDVICHIESYVKFVPFIAELLIIMTMACHRTHVVFNPPLIPIDMKGFYIFAAISWLFPVLNCFGMWLFTNPDGHFRPAQLSCTFSDNRNKNLTYWFAILDIFIALIPMVITIMANIALLWKVSKISRTVGMSSLPNRGGMIISFWVCFTFILSWLPTVVIRGNAAFVPFDINTLDIPTNHINRHLNHVVPQSSHVTHVPLRDTTAVILFTRYSLAINVVCNPVIYVLANRRFKRFVDTILRRWISCGEHNGMERQGISGGSSRVLYTRYGTLQPIKFNGRITLEGLRENSRTLIDDT